MPGRKDTLRGNRLPTATVPATTTKSTMGHGLWRSPRPIPASYEVQLVTRAQLARGRATGPPAEVHLSQVVEHGLRHLAWLVGGDEVIHEALADWSRTLSHYEPEPFRAFGREPGS